MHPAIAFKVAIRCVNFSSNWVKPEEREFGGLGHVSITKDLVAAG